MQELYKIQKQGLDDDIQDDLNKIPGLESNLTQALNNLKSRGINPESFGAKGDGATDDSQAIIDTLNHIKNMLGGKGKIVFPHGKTFKCNQPLGSHNLSNLVIDLNGATLDFADVSPNIGYDLISFEGTYSGTPIALTIDSTKLTKVITVSSTTGFVVGDMVRVYSNTIWDSQRTSTRIGEIGFVESVDSPTQLTLTTPIFDTYLVSASAKIEKLNPIENVTIMNGTIIGNRSNDEHMGVHIKVCNGGLLHNLTTKDIDKRHISLTDCVGVNVTDCTFFEANHTSQAYGISFVDSTRDCVARNNHFTHIRHSLSTNNNVSSSWGIVRRLLWDGNTVMDTAPTIAGTYGDSIDTHAGCEFITIINNFVNGSKGSGINFEGKSGIIMNNRIQNVELAGIYLRPYADTPSHFVVSGNEIITGIGDATGASDYGIRIYADVADCEYALVNGNIVESQISPISLDANDVTGKYLKRVVVSDNIVKCLRSGSSLSVTRALQGAVSGNSVEAMKTGIYLTTVTDFAISGNSVKLTGALDPGYGVYVSGVSESLNISSNQLRNSGTMPSSFGVSLGTATTYTGVFGNVTRGFTTVVALSTGTGNVQANNI